MPRNDEFYIGYESGMPAGVKRIVRRTVVAATAAVLMLAGIATALQMPLPDTRFAYGRPASFRGWLTLSPTPTLHVSTAEGLTRYWLVAPGKFGPTRVLHGEAEGPIELQGVLIEHAHWRMLEVVPGSLRRVSDGITPPPPLEVSSSRIRLRGEVVDSKCFLGVMNPGRRAAHRDCAVRCLSGGVPSMFAYQDDAGRSHLALLMVTNTANQQWAASAGTTRDLDGVLMTDGTVEVFVVGEL
jgi:hypothetical protein